MPSRNWNMRVWVAGSVPFRFQQRGTSGAAGVPEFAWSARMHAYVVATVLLLLAPSAGAALNLELVANGLDQPVAVTHAGDGRIFITLQRGTVVIHDGARVLPTPFLDIRAIVKCCSEEGLLSIAFHPRYSDNGQVYVYYTNRSGDNVVARYTRSTTSSDALDPASGVILLTIPHPGNTNHNGGQLHFGPDGYLYVGTGDGGSAGDPPNNAQNLLSLLGKILRLDVNGGSAYTIPATNPFAARNDVRGEIWAYGLRNPWRFSFDRANGDLWIGDVGQGTREEVNVQPFSSAGGENYGWRRMEGTRCFNPANDCQLPGMTLPVIEYAHGTGDCSVTGGFVYRGSRSPVLRGRYLYADFCSGRIWAATLTGGRWTSTLLRDTDLFVSAFGEDSSGEMYVADLSGGAVYRIVDDTQLQPRRRAVGRR